MDDNVHMQNSVQMINKFTELNKHFELMIYPGERHGIRDQDKEKHLDRLMFNWWDENFFTD
jgi:dipeptidyl-peptidase-4